MQKGHVLSENIFNNDMKKTRPLKSVDSVETLSEDYVENVGLKKVVDQQDNNLCLRRAKFIQFEKRHDKTDKSESSSTVTNIEL